MHEPEVGKASQFSSLSPVRTQIRSRAGRPREPTLTNSSRWTQPVVGRFLHQYTRRNWEVSSCFISFSRLNPADIRCLEERLPVSCCDRCAPDLLLRSAPHEAATAPKRKSGVTKGVVRPAVRDALFDWREDVHLKHHSEAMYDATAILSDDSVELLSAIGTVENIEVLKKALAADDWYWWSKHGEELFKLLHGLRIPPLERLPPKAKGPAKRKHDDSDMLVETQPASTSTKRAKNSGPDAVPALSQVPPSPAPPPVTVPPSIQRPPPTPLHPSATSSYPPSTPQARPLPYNAHVAPYGGGPLPIGSGYTRSYITPQQPYNQSYSRPSSYSYGLPTPTTTARSATAASCPQSLPAQTTPIHKPPNPNQQHAPNASSSKR